MSSQLSRREEKTCEILLLRPQFAVLNDGGDAPRLDWVGRTRLTTLFGVMPRTRR